MNSNDKDTIYIVDTSSIFSGKNLIFKKSNIITTPGVSKEITPGGKDYQKFLMLKEIGLKIIKPKKEFIDRTKEQAKKTGDLGRLSDTDIELIALALEYKNKNFNAIILTDDYSIENVADSLNLGYENISQSKISKRFNWIYKCTGCCKKFKENINICPICGSKTKKVVVKEKDLRR